MSSSEGHGNYHQTPNNKLSCVFSRNLFLYLVRPDELGRRADPVPRRSEAQHGDVVGCPGPQPVYDGGLLRQRVEEVGGDGDGGGRAGREVRIGLRGGGRGVVAPGLQLVALQ